MTVIHEPDGGERDLLASDVEYAETTVQQARGLMFRRSVPEDYALVFPFDQSAPRSIHTVFVPFPIDVCWLVEGAVESVRTLPAWRGFAIGTADTIVEFPAGTAADVAPGDTIALEQ